MYICPTCQRYFDTDTQIAKHFLVCWKEKNPYHKSKSAPRSENIEKREVSDAALNFFNSFGKEK